VFEIKTVGQFLRRRDDKLKTMRKLKSQHSLFFYEKKKIHFTPSSNPAVVHVYTHWKAVLSHPVLIQTLACMDWRCGGSLPGLKPGWRRASRRTSTGRRMPARHRASYPSTSKSEYIRLLVSPSTTTYFWSSCGFSPKPLFLLCRSDSVRRVLRIRGGPPNLLLVTGSEVALVDGKRLQLLWRFNSSSILGSVRFLCVGHTKEPVLFTLQDDVFR